MVKQNPCKPGSVPFCSNKIPANGVCHLSMPQVTLSALTIVGIAFYPLPRTGYPRTAVYANLQLSRCTATVSPSCWWSLTPPSHPYRHECRRLFSSALLNPYGLLVFSQVRCPLLPGLSSRTLWDASDRPEFCYILICRKSVVPYLHNSLYSTQSFRLLRIGE